MSGVVMSERQLSEAVYELATLLGWRGYHTYDSRRSAAGFPDWVFVRDGRLVFAELKTANGRTSVHQDVWLDALTDVAANGLSTVEVYVWRPDDWLSGRVEEVLRAA